MPITINGTTGISGVDGSAGTPALIGTDADTGLVFAAGQITASLNGSAANVPLVLATVQATTSGTSKDFTGIPSWVKRVTVSVSGVSTNGTSPVMIQIGTSSGIESTNYLGSSGYIQNAGQSLAAALSAGIYLVKDNAAANVTHGALTFTLVDASTNTWAFMGVFGNSNAVVPSLVAGSKALAGTLDRVRLTTLNGTDAFDAGSVNIIYE